MEKKVIVDSAFLHLGVNRFQKRVDEALAQGWQLDCTDDNDPINVHKFGWHRVVLVAYLVKPGASQ